MTDTPGNTPGNTLGTTNSLELTVIPSTPVIGAETTGIDLRTKLPSQQGAELRQLLDRHKVLFFRGQSINADQQLALGRSLGSILRFPSVPGEDPAHPGVQTVDNSEVPARRPDGDRYTGGWHIDARGLVIAPFASILRAVRLPPVGGNTVWANLAAAYEDLSDYLKRTVAGLYITHDVTRPFRARSIEYPLLAHPIVRTHPETGQRVLYINFLQYLQIVGWSAERRAEMVQILKEETTRPEHQVRFRWPAGAIAIWGSRAGHHYGVRDYEDFPRRMERVLIAESHLPLAEELT